MNRTVIIVGAGPVGLLLACELRLHNVETIVLESRLEPNTRSFGSALNAATVELLDQREVMESIRTVARELPGAHFQFSDHRIRIVKPGEKYPG